MIQEIITYIIISLTFGYVIFKFAKFLYSLKSKTKNVCSSCATSACSTCAFANGGFDLKKYNDELLKKNLQNKSQSDLHFR